MSEPLRCLDAERFPHGHPLGEFGGKRLQAISMLLMEWTMGRRVSQAALSEPALP